PFDNDELHNFRLWIAPLDNLRGAGAVGVIDNDELPNTHSTTRKKYDEHHRLLDPLFESVRVEPALVSYADGRVGDYICPDSGGPAVREFLIFRCRGFKGKFAGEKSGGGLPSDATAD